LRRFFEAALVAAEGGVLQKLVLSRPRPASDAPPRVEGRSFRGHDGGPQVQLVESFTTRDVTHSLAPGAAESRLRAWVPGTYLRAFLRTDEAEWQLLVGKRGQIGLQHKALALAPNAPRARPMLRGDESARAPHAADTAGEGHDRVKARWVDPEAPFLRELGVTNAAGVIPAMARKYRQIDRFVELLDHALGRADLSAIDKNRPLRIADFGCGKGYLTFAVHEHLRLTRGLAVETTGLELREELVASANRAALRCGIPGLRFVRGDLETYTPPAAPDAGQGATLDVMVALHACDTATDHALHLGVTSGAVLLVCSPCCHKELRPQLRPPAVLAPVLRHGVHLGQEAEMLTDTLRALLVEAEGYDTTLAEFVSLEHTSKNRLLLAVRRAGTEDAARRASRLEEIAALKDFYGVERQRLETLLVRN